MKDTPDISQERRVKSKEFSVKGFGFIERVQLSVLKPKPK